MIGSFGSGPAQNTDVSDAIALGTPLNSLSNERPNLPITPVLMERRRKDQLRVRMGLFSYVSLLQLAI